MGAVYRATDTKLNRDVAIKVLPEAFTSDSDRLTRFTREAQVLASLNHPNIAAIHGFENGALILELVEGSTLADRIAQGPIPIDEALPLIRQLIDALEYAHEKGIIHRDLKPSNIKITPEGGLKVLDFGLAKALSSDAAASDPASSPHADDERYGGRRDPWDCRLHEPGAGPRQAHRSPRRYLVIRRGRVRDAHRQVCLLRRIRPGHSGFGP
jgi:serine/threonine protein kinase